MNVKVQNNEVIVIELIDESMPVVDLEMNKELPVTIKIFKDRIEFENHVYTPIFEGAPVCVYKRRKRKFSYEDMFLLNETLKKIHSKE